ncbi:SDR family NAD(P)-dependent oxidoreductase [Streptomyces melanogenes]|uniref:SDR family NAD(P)-dependent oxidoreductase n=1 Tax=Streptomyces melanogenes TaxID=67326 RepID=UPI00199BC508|nr:SDR family oxidoreductase [Streptomyces melanogenes]GGP90681.1 hypothetical protein GCM10010278_81270 [Streptomyces melanogenes]
MADPARTLPPPSRALITGAGGGFGRAMAECFVHAGMRVALNGRNPETLSRVSARLRDLGGQVLELPGDAGDEATVRGALDRIVAFWGGVDVVVDNAGVGGCAGPLWSTPTDQWWDGFGNNVRTTVTTLAAAVPVLIASGGGRLVHISSAAGVEGWPHASAYAAAKAAGISLCRDLARELAREPVKVFAFHPGILRTGLTEAVLRQPGGDRWHRLHAAWFTRQIRDGRTVPVPVAAGAVLALARGAYDGSSGRYLTMDSLSDPLA